MPFPTGWPPRPASGVRSLRFFVADTATGNFDDHAYIFAQQAGANPYLPTPYVAPGDETAVVSVGDRSITGTPLGGGAHAADANRTLPIGSQAQPEPMVAAGTIRVSNDGGADLDVSFDGTNVHDVVKTGEARVYRERHESGLAVRGVGVDFRIEAW